MAKFFCYNQNNSGGYHVQDGIADEVVVIEANDYEHANKIASKLGLFSYPFCSCCGERFWELSDLEKGEDTVAAAVEYAHNDSITVHYHNGRKETFTKDSHG